jgi:hypothetical protein
MKVSAIKRRLAAHGYWPKGWPFNEGKGPRTVARIKAFQKDHGLEVDGVVGPLTIKALNAPATQNAKGERAAAVNWAKSRVGVVEHPPESNQGPFITKWQELSGYPGGGVAWCQCFANASAYVGSKKRINPAWFGGYTVAVVDMADRGEHGLKRISLDEARPGDWVYFNWPGGDSVDHVGLFMHRDGDTVYTIEGNTSSGNSGSQSNGGGVFRRTRDRSLIAAVVRPPFRS